MKIIFVTIFILFSLPGLLVGQDEHMISKELSVSLSPLAYFDYKPKLRFGIEYWHKRFGGGMEIGIGNSTINAPILRAWEWKGDNYEYFSLRPQLKFKFDNIGDFQQFIGIEYLFADLSFTFKDDRYFPKDVTYSNHYYINFKSADYRNKMHAVDAFYGFDLSLNRILKLEVYSGVGYTRETISYNNMVNPSLCVTPCSGYSGWTINWLGGGGSDYSIDRSKQVGSKDLIYITMDIKLRLILWSNFKE